MALKFFYRRQKLVFIIMAVLMVSFLIGYQGLEMFFGRGGGEFNWADTRYGPLTNTEVRAAETDLRILEQLRFTPDQGRLLAALSQMGSEGPPSYALLVKEADGTGVRVGDEEVAMMLAAGGLEGDALDEFLANLRTSFTGMTEKRLRGIVGRWLAVYKSYLAGAAAVPSSRIELEQIYREFFETIRVRVGRVPVLNFMGRLSEADRQAATQPAAVEEYFEQHKARARGDFSGQKLAEAFGHGYRRPEDRASVLYVTVDTGRLREALGLEDDDAPPGGEELLQTHLDRAARDAKGALAEYARRAEPPEDPLKFYMDAGLVRPAEDLLETALPLVNVDGQPLREAVRELAARAGEGVRRIMMPAIDPLDEEAPLTLITTRITLGEALRQIVASARRPREEAPEPPAPPATPEPAAATRPATQPAARPAPKPLQWRWVTVEGLDGVIWAIGGDAGMDTLPLSFPRRTSMFGRGGADDLDTFDLRLLFGRTPAGQGLADLVFPPQQSAGGTKPPTIQVGEAGDDLASPTGVAVWRLAAFEPAGVPEKLTPEIREQVIEDLRTRKALELATDFARGIAERVTAGETSLGIVATGNPLIEAPFETEPLARSQQLMHLTRTGRIQPAYLKNYLYRSEDRRLLPYEQRRIRDQVTDPNQVEQAIRIQEDAKLLQLLAAIPQPLREEMMERLFELAPEDVGADGGEMPPAVEVIPVAMPEDPGPRPREVLIVRRIGYQPPARDEYQARRETLAGALRNQMDTAAALLWLGPDQIKKRVGYVEKKK